MSTITKIGHGVSTNPPASPNSNPPNRPQLSNIRTTSFDADVIDFDETNETVISSRERSESESSIEETHRHRSNCLQLTARRMRKMALPLVALVAATQTPQAEAGPGTYALCIASCMGGTAGAATPACLALCLPLLGVPSP